MSNASQTKESSYDVDLEKAIQLWSRPASLTQSVEDLFSTRIPVPGRDNLISPTHYDPRQGISVICYDDALQEAQEDIGRYFRPGEVFIGVKHHKPEHPTLESAGKEAVKFDATHISVGVGVEVTASDGTKRNGAVTINNPQDYQDPQGFEQGHRGGLFGDPDYPMIFLRLKFPPELNTDQQTDYMANIRTWLVIANTYTKFPGDYNGGDPLATRSVSAIKTLGDKLLDALLGTFQQKQAALEWLGRDANMVYCAELAHVAVNLGIHHPLNGKSLGERLDALRQALESKDFLLDNKNVRARLIDLNIAPESLVPITEVIDMTPTEPAPGEPFGIGLALRPMTMTDLVQEFVQLVPREELGEQVAPPIQAALFKQVRPGLIEQMALEQLPADDPRRQATEQLLDKIEAHLEKKAENYQEFRDGLEPLLREAAKMSGPRPDGSGTFMPPHNWLLHALGRVTNEGFVMDLDVVGHGLHASILKPRAE